MYVPAHFAATDAEVESLLGSITAIDLVSTGSDGLVATFLPMLWDRPATGRCADDAHSHGSLIGHVARNNPQWQCTGPGTLAIVRGPDAYVSPSWYPSKAEHGRVVPTWNYLTAHVYGRLVAHDDVAWLRSLVTRLTDHYEAIAGTGWQVDDAPLPFIDGQLRAIVGVELVIERIEAKSKLSQNRSEADRSGVIAGLGQSSPISALMSPRPAPSAVDTS